jgi:hypothetical protein
MDKKLLFIMLALLSMKGSIMAQQQMYICCGGQADAYEVNCMAQLEMMPDSFRIRQQPAYAIEEVDSIVFHHPLLPCRELGWWGDVTDGQSLYKAQLRLDANVFELYGTEPEEFEPFDYDVLFIIEAEGGICQTVRCELHFSEEWMCQTFLELRVGKTSDTTGAYVYVRETGTGPRRFETWVTNSPISPIEKAWNQEGTMLWANCTDLLGGRPMEDVQMIVEAWVHQQPKQIRKSDFDNNPYFKFRFRLRRQPKKLTAITKRTQNQHDYMHQKQVHVLLPISTRTYSNKYTYFRR